MTLDSIEDKLSSAMGTGSSMPPGHRQCTIEITNKSSHYTLRDVSVYIFSGFCASSLPLQIEPSSSGKALFSKTGGTACGAVGVFTYDLYSKSTGQTAGSMAVMFSVPFDYNLYSNWYAVGVFEQSRACNYDLYVQMYYGEGDMFIRKKAGEDIDFKSGPFAIPASMTDTCQPILSLKVEDS
ncbi:DELTA-sagatoxin-Srs1a-like [Acanthopagrus latus]|uniref:DELTA-sagatoxin-Srs1a-like n=1 Tax=Acanthopagrus latus TaxID=8177 RepID=UPI00187CF52F|nr:DELTA-sagatoxin-Srs1a-like [Acanthopagrus latus]